MTDKCFCWWSDKEEKPVCNCYEQGRKDRDKIWIDFIEQREGNISSNELEKFKEELMKQ